MKKLISWKRCAFTVGVVASLSGFSVYASETNNATPPVLSIGADLNYPPYDYIVNNKAEGFDPTLLGLMAKQMGVELKFSDTRFVNLILGLRSNRFDVASAGMYVTPERAQLINFVPYMKTGVSLIVLSGSAIQPKTPEDLCGLKVSNIQGAAWIPKLLDFSKTGCVANGKAPIVVSEFPSSAEAAQTLFAKTADVQAEDSAVAAVAVKNTGGRIEISSEQQLFPVVAGYGIRKDNDALHRNMTQALEQLKASGEYAALLKEYNLGEPTAEEVSAALGHSN